MKLLRAAAPWILFFVITIAASGACLALVSGCSSDPKVVQAETIALDTADMACRVAVMVPESEWVLLTCEIVEASEPAVRKLITWRVRRDGLPTVDAGPSG